MATAGGLVFQGQIDGTFRAFDTRDGRELWSYQANSAVTGAPISFSVNGQQYVTVLAGPPGGTIAYPEKNKRFGWRYNDPRRVMTFALDGRATLPPAREPGPPPVLTGGDPVDPNLVDQGAVLYGTHCGTCHGLAVVTGGAGPDLRYSGIPLSREGFAHVVREGALLPAGMPMFTELSASDAEAIRSYVRSIALGSIVKGSGAPAAAQGTHP
jgi:quinohemoprotein ethanol dehydrogenase